MLEAAASAAGFHGIFDKLRRLGIADEVADDLYAQSVGNFWHDYCADEVADLVHIRRALTRPGQRVLDLACGAGRIAIALAREGAVVDGLELAPAMLALAEAARCREAPEVVGRLRFVAGDMAAFALPARYDLIVLGATSICLLLQPAQRQGLFDCAARHLAPGGRFVFDILEPAALEREFTDVLTRDSADGHDFAIVGQRRDTASGHVLFNVYRERIDWTGETVRTLGASVKACIDAEELKRLAERAGLRIRSRRCEGQVHHYALAAAGEED